MNVLLQHSCYQQLIQHCQATYPMEACGVLLGEINNDSLKNIKLTSNIAIKNIHHQPTVAFQFAPEQWINAYFFAKSLGLQVVGIYHSHPNDEPFPSMLDMHGFIDTNMLYAIISLKQIDSPQIQFYQLNAENEFINYPLVLT